MNSDTIWAVVVVLCIAVILTPVFPFLKFVILFFFVAYLTLTILAKILERSSRQGDDNVINLERKKKYSNAEEMIQKQREKIKKDKL